MCALGKLKGTMEKERAVPAQLTWLQLLQMWEARLTRSLCHHHAHNQALVPPLTVYSNGNAT